MSRITLLPLCIPLLLMAPAFAGEANAAPDGLRHETVTLKEKEFDVVHVDLREETVELYWKDPQQEAFGNFLNLKKWLESRDKALLFATNSGIYGTNSKPLGIHVTEGEELRPLNLAKGGPGNFTLHPNGVFYIDGAGAHVVTTEAYEAAAPKPELAVQSGPMLVVDGALHPKFQAGSDSVHIRNGVGVVSPHEVVFVISKQVVNLHTFASVFLNELDCENALYLDGSLSGMYAPFAGRDDAGLGYVGILAVTGEAEKETGEAEREQGSGEN